MSVLSISSDLQALPN